MPTFSDIVDAANELSIDEQATLLEILRRRIAEQNRSQIIRDVAEGRAEFVAGRACPASAKQIIDEARGGA